MTRNLHLIVQLSALFVQMVLPTIPGIPHWGHELAHALISFGQAAAGIMAHSYNVDGTPQAVAFEKAKP